MSRDGAPAGLGRAGAVAMHGSPGPAAPARALAVGVALLVGWGGVAVTAGLLSGRLLPAVAGGAAVTGALALAVAARWLDGLALLALSLPLPAVYATGSVRVGAAVVATAVLLGGWVLTRGPRRDPIRPGEVPVGWALLLLAAVAAAAVAATARGAAVREVVNVAALLGVLLAAADLLAGRPDGRARVAGALAVAVAGAGGAAILESLGVLPGRFPLADGPLMRAAGGFGWPNELAMFLAVGLPFAVHAYRGADSATGRVAGLLAILLAGGGLLATFSRGSWICVLLAPGILLLVGEGRTVVRIWLGVAVLALLADLGTGGAVGERVLASFSDASAVQRLALMGAGVLMFLENPVLGVGPGGFGEALERIGLRVEGLWDFVGSAHNAYLHMAAETGVVGLIAFVGLLAGVLLGLLRRARTPAPSHQERLLRQTLLWSFATACLVGMFEWTLAHGVGQLVLLVAALGLAEEGPTGPGSPP